MRILIAYDGSECAERALDDLTRAGLPQEAEAVIMSVANVFMPPAPLAEYEVAETAFDKQILQRARELSERAGRAVKQASQTAANASQRVRSFFPGWSVEVEAVGDSPAWAIINKAEEWNADLVVVGSHGRSAPGRFFLGSVSQKVVNEARCSVRIARGVNATSNAPVRIAIGMDGSPGAQAALQSVVARKWPQGSEVCVITALDSFMSTALQWVKTGDESQEAWVQRSVNASLEKLRAAGLGVYSRIKNGDAQRVLLAEAEQWGADSIFVGARGLRHIERLLLGSVSSAVAARARCSVEVARARQAV